MFSMCGVGSDHAHNPVRWGLLASLSEEEPRGWALWLRCDVVGTGFMSCWPWGVFWWPVASLVHCVWWEQRGLSDETWGAHPLFDGKGGLSFSLCCRFSGIGLLPLTQGMGNRGGRKRLSSQLASWRRCPVSSRLRIAFT